MTSYNNNRIILGQAGNTMCQIEETIIRSLKWPKNNNIVKHLTKTQPRYT